MISRMVRRLPHPERRRRRCPGLPVSLVRGGFLPGPLVRGGFLAVLLALGALLAGCGSSAGGTAGQPAAVAGVTGSRTAASASAARSAARSAAARRRAKKSGAKAGASASRVKTKGIAPRKTSQAVVGRVDAKSDAVLVAAGQATVSAGAPSDAQIRQEIKEAANDGIALPSGNTSASFLRSVEEVSITDEQALAVGASIPVAPWNPLGRPIANWIVPVLQWAFEHGWTGSVTSGYRTYAQQAELNAAGDFSAPACSSNHESTTYPGGAVDVTATSQLLAILPGYPGPEKLHGGVLGPIDPEHFSATGE
jgi:hypothetical protein